MAKEDTDISGDEKDGTLSRRELLSRYGPYTTPLVVSLLVPETAYAHNTMQRYSTTAACQADVAAGGNMHLPNMTGHCMVGGAAGGSQTHPITEHGS